MIHCALLHPFLGSFWGISEGEQGRPTVDFGGDFDGRKNAHFNEILVALI
jgi:hypothetical protein